MQVGFFPEIFDNLNINNLVKEYIEISLEKGEKFSYDGIIFVNEGILGLYENGKIIQKSYSMVFLSGHCN